MCGRFDTSHLTWAEIHGQLSNFAPAKTAPLNLEQNNDVRPTTAQVTARLEEGGWVLEKMRWGLVPFWRDGKPLKDTAKGADDGWKLTTFNCRGETAATSRTSKGAFERRCCIVPASSWYDWTGEKGSKIKHTFARADGGTIWFGGLWDRVTTPDTGEVSSFSILTHQADGWLTDYHSRAPMILDPLDWMSWLNPASISPHLPRAERFHLTTAAAYWTRSRISRASCGQPTPPIISRRSPSLSCTGTSAIRYPGPLET